MKKIEAIIRPSKVEDINEALTELGIEGMTTIDMKRFRRQEGHIEIIARVSIRSILTPALGSICTVLNPSTIILAGDIAANAKLLTDCLRERLHGKVPQVPNIVISQLGHRAVAFGAITLVLDATTFNLPMPGV